jgi:hypothetical protein
LTITEEELLTQFPDITIKDIKQAIKYQFKFNLNLENLKCLNMDCNNIRKFFTTTRGYGLTCGHLNCKQNTKEIRARIKQTNTINTCMQKYGVNHPSKIKETRIKAKETYFERTGYNCAASNPEVIRKRRETCLFIYGVKHPNMLEASKSKMRDKNLEKYGSSHFKNSHLLNFENWNNKEFWIEEFLDKDKRFDYIKCQTYFNCSEARTHQKIKELKIDYNRLSFISISEKQVLDIIKINIPESLIQENIRDVIKPYELDIYVPDYKLAIEYNGIYWHSYMSEKRASCTKQTQLYTCQSRHLQKTNACQSKGIKLLHIFETEWINPIKQNIWKSIITGTLDKGIKLDANDLKIKNVSKLEAKTFLEYNHLQGYTNCTLAYGLYKDAELMSLMVFNNSDNDNEWLLVRFCNKLGYNILEAASKLLNNFREKYVGSIKTTIDRRWDNDNLYKTLGFKEFTINEPEPFYWHLNNSNVLFSESEFQNHKTKFGFEKNLSTNNELQTIIDNKFAIIYDSGSITYKLD